MAAFLISFSLCGGVFAQTWTSMGPTGGDVRSLAIDPSRPALLYLGTADGYIFDSQDAGEHWQSVGLIGPRNGVITAILVDPRNSGSSLRPCGQESQTVRAVEFLRALTMA